MKKNDFILLSSVLAYSICFYNQTAGINFLLFNILLISLLLLRDSKVYKNTQWSIAALGSILSSLCICYLGNALSTITNIISLSLLSGLSFNRESSAVFSILFAFYSYITAPIYILCDWSERLRNKGLANNEGRSKKAKLIIIPVLITLLFLLMYQQSSPFLNEILQNINFDFISWSWIFFTLGGFILLYGFFYHRSISYISNFERNKSNELNQESETESSLLGRKFGIEDLNYSGKILFVMLNLLLLLVNSLDINFLFIGHQLPKGVNYSQFVHQGTDMIILSIIVAIVIILYFFRGALNFYSGNKLIKGLVYIWILQNVLMLLSTALRNEMYISELGLTYKRIGVYFYLSLCGIGLITTLIKILKAKSNIYLFRVNGWVFYAVLVSSCFFAWDQIITDFNLNKAKRTEYEYLYSLSDSNVPELLKLYQMKVSNKQGAKFLLSTGDSAYLKNEFCNRVYNFLRKNENVDWRSWNYEKHRIYNAITADNFTENIDYFSIEKKHNFSFKYIYMFDQLKVLNLKYCAVKDIKELLPFNSLERLDLRGNPIETLEGIQSLKNLKYLNLDEVEIKDCTPLYGMKNLKEIHLSLINTKDYESLKLNLPDAIIY